LPLKRRRTRGGGLTCADPGLSSRASAGILAVVDDVLCESGETPSSLRRRRLGEGVTSSMSMSWATGAATRTTGTTGKAPEGDAQPDAGSMGARVLYARRTALETKNAYGSTQMEIHTPIRLSRAGGSHVNRCLPWAGGSHSRNETSRTNLPVNGTHRIHRLPRIGTLTHARELPNA